MRLWILSLGIACLIISLAGGIVALLVWLMIVYPAVVVSILGLAFWGAIAAIVREAIESGELPVHLLSRCLRNVHHQLLKIRRRSMNVQ